MTEPFHDYDQDDFKFEQEQILLVNRIKHGVVSLVDVAKQFNNLYQAVNKIIPPFLNDAMTQVNQELSSFRRLTRLQTILELKIFDDSAVAKYRSLEGNYRNSFYITLGLVVILSIADFL